MSFKSLTNDQQKIFARLCVERRAAYELWKHRQRVDEFRTILIVGDQPGPRSPQTDNFHHTPFYSKTHSGGYITAQLVLAEIPNRMLMWCNSASWDGKSEPDAPLLKMPQFKHIIALGRNAEAWLKKHDVPHVRFDHPQAHFRFKNKEPYPLIPYLKTLTTSS